MTQPWDFRETVMFAKIDTQQLAAGCPFECDSEPLKCGRAVEEMPELCRKEAGGT